MIYSERIRILREDRDKKQSEIANILNKSQQGYAHLENDNARLSIDDLITLCKYYNVTADYILGLTDEIKELPKK